ncbi:MAG: hypothetical protein IJT23_10630 [Clostridia bacterium]|nr:hypothetical protein [Clostridia bacterium]
MKKYTKPSVEAVEFEKEDILTASAAPGFVKEATKPEIQTGATDWDYNWNN